ncbi:hypothetical protein EU642_22135 [Salmonella enterica]|nr:hypothetical protein [Salmonella enterica]EAO0118554.1 hypothetical protein [Salmonella enterica]EAO3601659.1 hypothetical protein [Salmonella enterica]EAR6391552.1 hypothetical protein [Salmonella enterica]EAV1285316.1 hypothetical protein [Salmonella enterica]
MKTVMPWVLLGFMVVIVISGAIGLFIGFNMAETRFQEEKISLVKAQNKALDERDKLRIAAEEKNLQLETQFLASVQELTANYKQLAEQLGEELKQDIYHDCHVPDSGKELLKKRVTEANKRK